MPYIDSPFKNPEIWQDGSDCLFLDIEKICKAQTRVDELLAVLKKVHPWSSLHYGLSATDVVKKLYLEWIPKYFGNDIEIRS